MTDATLAVRRATPADIPFLAWMDVESSLPPHDHSFYTDLLAGTGTTERAFVVACLEADAMAWGGVEQFFILEQGGEPVAAGAGIEPDADFPAGPIRTRRLPDVGARLGWTAAQTQTVCDRVLAIFGDGSDGGGIFAPIAPYTIETVAVVPHLRGRGLGGVLLTAIIEDARARGHASVAIAVMDGNARARRAYEKLGFRLYMAYGPAYFDDAAEDFPGYTKLRLNLGQA